MWCAVGTDKAVATKIAVMQLFTKMAAIGPKEFSVFIGLRKPVVAPFPNKPAAQSRLGVKGINIFA